MEVREVKYGKFKNENWYTLNGLESANVVLTRIKDEIDWSDFNLYVHGSILNDVDTHDIDFTITGPNWPQRINLMLEHIVKIGFEEQIYCDVKYSITGDLYDPVTDISKEIHYANYAPQITVNGKTYTYAKLTYGLYVSSIKWPLSKTIGKEYASPLKLI